MANDLTVTLGANVDNAVANLKRGANAVEEVGRKADSVDKQLKRMNWGVAGNALAVGFQDFTSVVSNGGSLNQGLNAIANNLVQVASMAGPIPGFITAIGIAGVQIAPMLMGTVDNMKKLKEEAEATKKAMEDAAAIKFGEISAASRPETKEDIAKAMKSAAAERERLRQVQVNIDKELLDQQSRNVNLNDPAVKAYREALIKRREDARAEENNQEFIRQRLAERYESAPTEATQKAEDEWKDMLKSIPGIMQKSQDETVAANTKKAEEAAEKKKREDKVTAEIFSRIGKDVEQERRRNNPVLAMKAEAERLKGLTMWGGLSEEEMRTSIQRQVQQTFGQGPQLASGFVKGSVEEVSLRNRAEAQQRNEQFISKQVDKIIAALPEYIPLPTYGLGASG